MPARRAGKCLPAGCWSFGCVWLWIWVLLLLVLAVVVLLLGWSSFCWS